MSVRSVRSESQRGLKQHAAEIQMDSLGSRRNKETGFSKEAGLVKQETMREYEGEAKKAKERHYDTAFFDLVVAALPLYFVAFAFLAFAQNGTPVGLDLNQIILNMADFNPTAFPIVFGLIATNFLKAAATFKLERGVTVATIQQLLGSKSFVSSIVTSLKLHTLNFTVLVIIAFWVLDPVGGQSSLRAAYKDSNYTIVDTTFSYLDLNTSPFQLLNAPNYLSPINAAFSSALISPTASKNGSQDLFGNIQIPMLEALKQTQKADSDGWYRTAELAALSMNTQSDDAQALEDFLGIPDDADASTVVPPPVYMSLAGLPFLLNSSQPANTQQTGLTDPIGIGGLRTNMTNTESQFKIETSYFYLDCSVGQDGTSEDGDSLARGINTATGVVSNNHGLSISYDFNHTANSTAPRQVTLNSWNGHSNKADGAISKASCQLSTSYVEASVYCSSNSNCSVQAVRTSVQDNPNPVLSQLDGIAPSWNATSNTTQAERKAISDLFFASFITATGNLTQGSGLSPMECYFLHPENPYQCAIDDQGQYALYQLGDTLFSQRFSQLLNTYWIDNVAPYSSTGNFALTNPLEQSITGTSPGQMRIESIVLRCRVSFMILLVAISLVLFIAGLATAYMDATRRIPDILDQFPYSLRYDPYIQGIKQGPSVEDSSAVSKRYKNAVVQMGDVRPEDPAGLIAIGTPTYEQPIRMIQHDRTYR